MAFFFGTDAGEIYNGTAFGDVIYGGRGDDTLNGNGGNDVIFDGFGNDTVDGGAGNDTIYGVGGVDSFDGGTGVDTYVDTLEGFDPDVTTVFTDFENGTHGQVGTATPDTLAGFENYRATGDIDIIFTGNNLANVVTVEGGDDIINTRGGNDTVFAGAGDDTIDGGGGNDDLTGGEGNDTLTGGAGADDFIFASGFGIDTITDFDLAQDRLIIDSAPLDPQLTPEFIAGFASVQGGDTVFNFGALGRLTVEGVTDITALTDAIFIA